MDESLHNCKIQRLTSFSAKDMPIDILRLDLLHPVVSGNKWFKLKYYLQDAIASGKQTIATFGGAYSNHIVAAAYAAKQAGLKSFGFIRGERPEILSTTLEHAIEYGMELVFTDRTAYQLSKQAIMKAEAKHDFYWIMEGGYGKLGAKGAADILKVADTSGYSHIICSAGTGTMMAGLVSGSLPGQKVIGISALKNYFDMENEVRFLLDEGDQQKPFTIDHGHHFGGYAKHPPELIGFMKEIWEAEQLPTDIVYTSKMLVAVKQLIAGGYFSMGSNLLLIHSGGLQGNNSLPAGTLPFS